MLDCAKSELMALAESKTPIQSLKDDLKPGGKLELLELCLKEGTENRFTLNNYTTALVENVNKRFPDVEVLTELELFNPLLLPDKNRTQFACYGNESIAVIFNYF